jgi:hypothetical protein
LRSIAWCGLWALAGQLRFEYVSPGLKLPFATTADLALQYRKTGLGQKSRSGQKCSDDVIGNEKFDRSALV